MMSLLRRLMIRNAFHEAREDIYESLAEELKKDSAKRTETISATFEAWARRDAKRKLPIAIAHASIVRRLNDNGDSFADAIGPLIPFEERMIIWAGEHNGELSTALLHAVRVKNALSEMKDAVRAAVAQPAFGFLGVLFTSAMLGVLLWPEMLRDIKPQYWPGWALPGIYWDLWLARNWPVLGIIGILIGAYYYTLPRWTGRSRQWIDRFPPWSAYREENANVLLTTLAGFLSNRFVITDACEKIRERATPYLRWHLNQIIPKIEGKGESALEAFNTGLLSRPILDRLQDANRTRDLDKTIIHVGDKALKALVRHVKARANIINTLGSLIVAVFFLYSAAVQLIATQDATDRYASHLQSGRSPR